MNLQHKDFLLSGKSREQCTHLLSIILLSFAVSMAPLFFSFFRSTTETPAPLNSVERTNISSHVQMESNAIVISNKSPCNCQNLVLSDAEIDTDSRRHTNSIFLKLPDIDEARDSSWMVFFIYYLTN